MAKRIYPFLPVRWLTYFEYDTKKYVTKISCPILVIHSKNDEIIPFEEGRGIYNAAPEARQFLELQGGHNEGFLISGSIYVEGLRSFISESFK